jgi:hypothetical protein
MKNYEATREGFTVVDAETGHILKASYRNGTYRGLVVMPDQGRELPLEPWEKGRNPFEDDMSFEGSGGQFGDAGFWWFAIEPSAPFSQIMAEVEALSGGGFFKRLFRSSASGAKLADITPKQTNSGFIFWDINDDLGKAAEPIMKSSVEVQMAYGYARRSAVAAMYLQGIAPRDAFEHVVAVFKSLQGRTGQTVDFQRRAFHDSIDFMQTYSPLITSLFVKTLVPLASQCEPAGDRTADADLFREVTEYAYGAQEEAQRKQSS